MVVIFSRSQNFKENISHFELLVDTNRLALGLFEFGVVAQLGNF